MFTRDCGIAKTIKNISSWYKSRNFTSRGYDKNVDSIQKKAYHNNDNNDNDYYKILDVTQKI